MFNNQLLDSLTGSQFEDLRKRLRQLNYLQGDILGETDASIEQAIFPSSGLISVVTDLSDGERIEVAMVGPRGVIGGAAVFGSTFHLATALAQLPGRAWIMPLKDLKELASTSADFRRLLFARERYLLAQAQQTAACNAKHTINQRLCSWLLRAHDAACGGGELLITQEHLAHMLGVQRASVSLFASQLQEEGLIRYRRGRVQIRDMDRLRAHACECYMAVRRHYERLFAPDEDRADIPPSARETVKENSLRA